jgi:hypothetical protein
MRVIPSFLLCTLAPGLWAAEPQIPLRLPPLGTLEKVTPEPISLTKAQALLCRPPA